MTTADTSRGYSGFVAIDVKDACNRIGQIVDECQRGPVILCKNQQHRAAVVSMIFLEQALEALHGYREVITPRALTIGQKADLAASWPNADERTNGRWENE